MTLTGIGIGIGSSSTFGTQGIISIAPTAIAEPTISARLAEAEGYLDNAASALDELQGVGQTNAADVNRSTTVTSAAARVCEKAAILSSRIKTIAGMVGGAL